MIANENSTACQSMLTLQNVSFSYKKGRPVIKNFSMNFEQGTVCGLLGKNGSGKSTLLYLICGLLKPDSGNITFKGMTPLRRDVAFLNDVFIVPEEFEIPNLPMSEFVKVNAPLYPNFNQQQMEEYMKTFEIDPSIHLKQCSMGQKKKAFISFALACNTSLLILDEPTNGLDISSKRAFRKAIAMSMRDDRSVIISTHHVYDVEKIIDRVMIVDPSGVLLDKSMYEIMNELSFSFTTDRERAVKALISLDAPGGWNIVEPFNGEETEVNLESLFELIQSNPIQLMIND